MSGKAKQEKTTGEIVNLMSVDAQRLMDVTTYIYGVYSSPIQIVVALALLYKSLGPSIFAGFGVMILLIPLNFILSYLGRKYQVRCACILHDLYYMHVTKSVYDG